MFPRTPAVLSTARLACCVVLVLALVAAVPSEVQAQVFSNQRAVGGVMLDASGMIRDATVVERGQLRQEVAKVLREVPGELAGPTQMRKVSLKRLDAALAECAASGQPVPDEIHCLAGLQQIRYVLVDPDQNDILLVGPAEGWRVADDGSIVGITTGKPVLLLDDLVVAFRAVNRPDPRVISCSIDPSSEGYARVQRLAKKIPSVLNPAQTAGAIERELGPQVISVDGIPANSHFAAVLVAADYRMKQIGMGLAAAPVRGLPSFLELMQNSRSGMSNMMPRWWLEPDYGTILTDEEGLVWEISSSGVKTMTENDFFTANGQREQSGRTDPVSRKWAEAMTARYTDLAVAEPVFGQLQGCMDLAVAATLIARKGLLAKAACEVPMLASNLQTAEIPAPQQVASRASLVRNRGGWLVACGGVQINPWVIIDRTETKSELGEVRDRVALADGATWWSN